MTSIKDIGMKVNFCYQGDCREAMRQMLAEGGAGQIQTIVTSPPYWGLRDYGMSGQLGQEKTFSEFLANMVEVFSLCWDMLADDGTMWVNMGDSYARNGGVTDNTTDRRGRSLANLHNRQKRMTKVSDGLKPKNIVGQPWRLAFALQEFGWNLRQDIIWHKPNPMPESVRDRFTKSHEYLFLLTKSEKYYFDQEAILEPISAASISRLAQDIENQSGSDLAVGKTNGPMKAVRRSGNKERKDGIERGCPENAGSNVCGSIPWEGDMRNKRSVWTISTEKFTGAHFAVMPTALVEPCILAGSRPGDMVFDPFMGSGTVAEVSQNLGRKWVGTELNPEYIKLQNKRAIQLGLELVA